MSKWEYTYEDYLRELREETYLREQREKALNRSISEPVPTKGRRRVYKVRVEFPDVTIAHRKGGDV